MDLMVSAFLQNNSDQQGQAPIRYSGEDAIHHLKYGFYLL
jgi:hypothetical protein